MPKKRIRSTYSKCPFQIRMLDEHGIISTGTAFFYCYSDSLFLITNWHNISGRHFLTKKPLFTASSVARFPTHIEAHLSSYDAVPLLYLRDVFTTLSTRVEIYKDYEPLWFEHPSLNSSCDVIALPIQRPSSCPAFMHNAANLISTTPIPVLPGCSAFVIGFPKSLSVGFGLPIWKSGYVASDPCYDVTIDGRISNIGGLTGGTELPAFFLDIQTREGMSGSPVFASYSGTWDTSDPYAAINPDSPGFFARNDVAIGHTAMEFIGCYSARIGKAEEGAALGLCWPEKVIELICSARNTGINPHVSNSVDQ